MLFRSDFLSLFPSHDTKKEKSEKEKSKQRKSQTRQNHRQRNSIKGNGRQGTKERKSMSLIKQKKSNKKEIRVSRRSHCRNVTCAGWNKGKKWSKEIIKKFSIAKINLYLNKENHPRWMGGKSFEPYSLDWTNTLKKEIRQRDNYTCQLCGCRQEDTTHLVHHIDYNKKNCNPDNLITLCRSCHTKTNTNRDYWLQFFKGKQNKEVLIIK